MSGRGKEARTAADAVDHLQDCRQANLVGEVEAADEREAIEKAAKEFNQHPMKLIAVRRP